MIKAILTGIKKRIKFKKDLQSLNSKQKEFVNQLFKKKRISIDKIDVDIDDLLEKEIVSISGAMIIPHVPFEETDYIIVINTWTYNYIKKNGKL